MKKLPRLLASTAILTGVVSYAHAQGIPLYDPLGDVFNLEAKRSKLIMAPGARGIFDVDKNFGAVGDGVTNDSTAFLNALAACKAAGGGHVIFGPRQYYIPVNLVIPEHCELAGLAPNLSYSANNPAFFVTQPYELLMGMGAKIQLGSGSIPDQGAALSNMAIVRAGMTPATDYQSSVALTATYTGNAILIPHTSQGSMLTNLAVAGFDLAIDNESNNAHIQHIYGDNTNGYLGNNNTDYNFVDDVMWQSVPSATPDQFQRMNITNISDDGTGQAQITVSNTARLSAFADNGPEFGSPKPFTMGKANIANGNTIYIGALSGHADLKGKWPIANLSVGSTTTTFTLVGSVFGASTVTGSVTLGSNYIKGLTPLKPLGYFGGAVISDSATGSCIPAGTLITWINWDTTEAYLSNAATCTANNEAVVVTPSAYAGDGIASLNAGYRSGYGFKISNGQAGFYSDVFDWGHQTQFWFTTGSNWSQVTNFGADGDAYTFDPSRIGILIDRTASMEHFSNGLILDDAIPIKINTSGALSAGTFPNIFNTMNIYNNYMLGAEVLSGGAQFAAGVNFRSVYPNFVGDNAAIQMLANNSQTANPQTLYQSSADVALVKFNSVGNFATSGNGQFGGSLGLGGAPAPPSGVSIVSPDDTAVGFIQYIGTNGNQNYFKAYPQGIMMHRAAGDTKTFTISTLAASWGATPAAGAIQIAPAQVNTLTCFNNGTCDVAISLSRAPNATFEVGGSLRISGGLPTIAANACGTTTQGAVVGSDETGAVLVGTGTVTTCNVSFSVTLPAIPRSCSITPANSVAAATNTTLAYVSAMTASGFTISGAALAGARYNFVCM